MIATLRRHLLASTSPMALHLGSLAQDPGHWRKRPPQIRMAEPRPGAFKPIKGAAGLYDFNP